MTQALSKSILRIYPIPEDDNNTWVSPLEVSRAPFHGTDSVFVRQSLPVYLQLLKAAKRNGDYTEADKKLDKLKKFQKKNGANIYPDVQKIDLEIVYNKSNLFLNLFRYYGVFGVLLIFVVVFKIFYSSSKFWKYATKILIGISILFLSHTAGLIVRWYVVDTHLGLTPMKVLFM